MAYLPLYLVLKLGQLLRYLFNLKNDGVYIDLRYLYGKTGANAGASAAMTKDSPDSSSAVAMPSCRTNTSDQYKPHHSSSSTAISAADPIQNQIQAECKEKCYCQAIGHSIEEYFDHKTEPSTSPTINESKVNRSQLILYFG